MKAVATICIILLMCIMPRNADTFSCNTVNYYYDKESVYSYDSNEITVACISITPKISYMKEPSVIHVTITDYTIPDESQLIVYGSIFPTEKREEFRITKEEATKNAGNSIERIVKRPYLFLTLISNGNQQTKFVFGYSVEDGETQHVVGYLIFVCVNIILAVPLFFNLILLIITSTTSKKILSRQRMLLIISFLVMGFVCLLSVLIDSVVRYS